MAGVNVGGSWSRGPYFDVAVLLLLWSELFVVSFFFVPFFVVAISSLLFPSLSSLLLSAVAVRVRRGYNDDRLAHPVRPPTETNIHRPDGSVPCDGKTMERVSKPVVSDCGFGGGGGAVFFPFALLLLLLLLLSCSSG